MPTHNRCASARGSCQNSPALSRGLRDSRFDCLPIADLPVYACEVVAIDGSSTSRNSARRPLGRIALITGHTFLGGYVRRDHFEQIELRSYLKSGMSVSGTSHFAC